MTTKAEKRVQNPLVERESETPELLAKYLEHIGQGKLLTHQEEIDLSECARPAIRKPARSS